MKKESFSLRIITKLANEGLFKINPNKTSIQWTPDVKLISAPTKKSLVKNDF